MTKQELQQILSDASCLACFGMFSLAETITISQVQDIATNGVTFNAALCAVTAFADGGGTTFECYDVGSYDTSMPLAGTLFTALYVGNNPSLIGDTFEDYSVGAYAGGTPGSSVTGYGTIYVS